jgi:hypothetical protein
MITGPNKDDILLNQVSQWLANNSKIPHKLSVISYQSQKASQILTFLGTGHNGIAEILLGLVPTPC